MARASRWGAAAEAVIRQVLAECQALDLDQAATLKQVDAAYPFGERAHWPYKAWLRARRELLGLPGSISGADRARLRAWEAGTKQIDPGAPLTELERYLETLP